MILYDILLNIDLRLSRLTGGRDGETISARLYQGRESRNILATFIANLVDFVAFSFLGQPNHCYIAYLTYLEYVSKPQ